jgi:hypothetical protein
MTLSDHDQCQCCRPVTISGSVVEGRVSIADRSRSASMLQRANGDGLQIDSAPIRISNLEVCGMFVRMQRMLA